MTGIATFDDPVGELLAHVRATPRDATTFDATAPDWFGPRVFGGLALAQGLHAAAQTVDGDRRPHSMHAAFLGGLQPGRVELDVELVRDGRTFSTRDVRSSQGSRTAMRLIVSFRADEAGDEYQLPMPDEIPLPDSLATADGPPPFDVREIGPTPPRSDGTYTSTRRYWVRTVAALPDDPLAHACVAAFLSDMTGTSFRPKSLGEWGTHADASVDHAAWFHRPFVADDWLYADFHALVNASGCSTVRGEFYDRGGRLCMSMAQELLIRPLV